jgi:hypothetical protein
VGKVLFPFICLAGWLLHPINHSSVCAKICSLHFRRSLYRKTPEKSSFGATNFAEEDWSNIL